MMLLNLHITDLLEQHQHLIVLQEVMGEVTVGIITMMQMLEIIPLL